jgi:hypothetical protein
MMHTTGNIIDENPLGISAWNICVSHAQIDAAWLLSLSDSKKLIEKKSQEEVLKRKVADQQSLNDHSMRLPQSHHYY